MQDIDAIRALAEAAGYSLSAFSRAVGRSRNFVANTINAHSSPTLATAALLAEASGYSLAFVPRADLPRGAIVIDSPRPLASSDE